MSAATDIDAGRAPGPRVHFIVDPLDTGRSPVELARAMLGGGARLLQLRLKQTATGTLVDVAARLRELTTAAGARLIVNDRVDVALAAAADGVHLGQDDLPIAVARRLLGPERWIGFSTHSEAQLAAAAGCGADYLSLGPIFATTSKSQADPVIGTTRLRAARARVSEPLVAIGGITATTAREVLDAGADAIAIIAAVVRAPDVTRAVAELLEIAESTPSR